MLTKIEAVYEGGVLRLLEPVELSESQHVTVMISTEGKGRDTRAYEFMERARAETAHLKDIPSIEEVRAALAVIPDSLSEVIIAERGEY